MRRFSLSITTFSIVLAAVTASVAVGQPAFDANRGTEDGVSAVNSFAQQPTGEYYMRLMTPMLLGTYENFDNWNLDTSWALDAAGNIQVGVRLWEYSDRNEHFDRYVISPAGELVETYPNWIGPGDQAVIDANGHYDFLLPTSTTQWFGVTDSLNNIHTFYTHMEETGWEVVYSKLDPTGAELIAPKLITTEAHPWNFYLQPVALSDDTVMVTWTRDTDDICGVKTTDGGETWSDVTVLIEWKGEQASALKTEVGSDDSLHFVWRELDWNNYEEKAWYAKVRKDWTIAVSSSVFHEGPCWYPCISMDEYDNVHVTFTTDYQETTNIYYTRLNGELDLNGAPATEAELVETPLRMILSDSDTVHYPFNVADGNGAVHVFYEEGGYGRYTDKDLYYLAICTQLGDMDCDEDVDLSDLATVLATYGKCAGDAGFEGLADMNKDGCVNLSDLAALLANYGAGM